jgi:hypothetical protein
MAVQGRRSAGQELRMGADATLTLPAALTLRDARSAMALLGPAIAESGESTITIDASAARGHEPVRPPMHV